MSRNSPDATELAVQIRAWGRELGFQRVGFCDTELSADEARLMEWLAAGRHGDMSYMARHGTRRSRPGELLPGTITVISVRMDYLPADDVDPWALLQRGEHGYISRYALGRDYHKVMRGRLKGLARRIEDAVGAHGWRVFVDSAPVLEKPLAGKAGQGWMGKHTNMLDRDAGSWFFLGEIYTDLALPTDTPVDDHCGTCSRCIGACPTGAITAPYELDARLCISYLTIEHHGPIPLALRPLMGNRIYGCDDCQLVCPWNRFATPTAEADFQPRHGLSDPDLVDLFEWTEAEFLRRTEGSPIRRIGHVRWLRNIAVALGNAPPSPRIRTALESRLGHPHALVREHTRWALERQTGAAEAQGGRE